MENTIVITKDGQENEYEIIDMLNIDGTEYIVYSDNELDSMGNNILNISKLNDTGSTLEIEEISDEEYQKAVTQLQENIKEA